MPALPLRTASPRAHWFEALSADSTSCAPWWCSHAGRFGSSGVRTPNCRLAPCCQAPASPLGTALTCCCACCGCDCCWSRRVLGSPCFRWGACAPSVGRGSSAMPAGPWGVPCALLLLLLLAMRGALWGLLCWGRGPRGALPAPSSCGVPPSRYAASRQWLPGAGCTCSG